MFPVSPSMTNRISAPAGDFASGCSGSVVVFIGATPLSSVGLAQPGLLTVTAELLLPWLPRQRVRAGGGDQSLRHPVVDVAEAIEARSLVLDDVEERAPVELHVGEVLEQDVDRLDVGTLELLPSQRGPMHSRKIVELITDD